MPRQRGAQNAVTENPSSVSRAPIGDNTTPTEHPLIRRSSEPYYPRERIDRELTSFVEQVANQKLRMTIPSATEVKIVQP